MPKHVYSHDKGFGQHHAEAAGRELPAEMRDLDLAPGTEVEVEGTDETTGQVLITWTDQSGVSRRTAVTPDFLAGHFTEQEA